jgi:hypothetical protein
MQAELAAQAGVPAPEPPAGLNPEQEAEWLENLVRQRRAEMGLNPETGSPQPLPIPNAKSTCSPA